jgi:hypothetical protein
VFVDCTPQPVVDPADVHTHLVKVPPRTPTGFSVAKALSEEVAELDAPRPDGLTCHGDASFQQQFLNISVTQGEAVVQPDRVADEGKGEPVTGELLTAQHRVTLPHQLATTVPSRPKGVRY